jgi:hypothetical protein
LGAHFLRSGSLVFAVLIAASPLLLLIRRTWATRTLQVILLVGAAEWMRTLVSIASARQAAGMPWMRMAAILGTVALVTLISALLLSSRRFRERVEKTEAVAGA